MNQKSKYRLRINSTIIGYAEELDEGILLKGNSVEQAWYNLKEYNKIDRHVGIQDKFHRDIYENDLVNYRLNGKSPMRKGVILQSQTMESFGILDLESKHFTHLFINDICLFQSEKMEIYSHLFNHPELESKFT
ncbi:hypothetical protein [Moheibacter stercoris]|uniref:YopX protein n=1 Tax=Moheibacter stercoris TaxID=1628251 RepID=A0ABV2LWW4_9FLAO